MSQNLSTVKQRVFIIDTMGVVYRSHFAMIRSPLINSKGVNVSGLHGLLHTLVSIIEREQPEYLAVTSDSIEPTFRHKRFKAYKATREKMPQELVSQLPYIPRIVESLGLPLLIQPGYEADDLIGTLVKQAGERGMEAYIVSGDKDCLQLLNPNTFIYTLRGGSVETTGEEGAKARFGCAPSQVVDALALIGDASDNVPGAPGVGPKTAAKLLAKYHNLAGIYQHLEHIKGEKLRKNLAEYQEQVLLSRALVTICCKAPLPAPFASLATQHQPLGQNEVLLNVLSELEFQSLRDRLMRSPGKTAQAQTKVQEPRQYYTLRSLAAIEYQVQQWLKASLLAMDTETEGLNPFQDALVGLSFAVKAHEAFYIPLNHPHLAPQKEAVLQALAPLFASETPQKCGHNLKFDLHVLQQQAHLPVAGLGCDTMIASFLCEPVERRHDLDSVCLRQLGIQKIPTSSILGKGKKKITMAQAPIAQVAEYACEDADMTLRLAQHLTPRLQELQQMQGLQTLEMPLIPVLLRMETQGIDFDQAGCRALCEKVGKRLLEVEEAIYQAAGERFHIQSILQLQEVMYGRLKLHEKLGVRPRKIKLGLGFSTDEETLEKMQSHPLPKALLEHRFITKLRSGYLEQLPNHVNPKTQRIHSSFRQTSAVTGRLASDNPNLQNIPIRSPLGRELRALFLPSQPGHVLLCADYSQIELRIVAHYSQDPAFLQAYQNNLDIHTLTAATIFNKPQGEVTHEMRAVAKGVNFGLIYRMGAERLSLTTGVSREEARAFIQRFFETFSKVHNMQKNLIAQARKEGYAQTLLGRRRYLPELHSQDAYAVRIAEGAAVNTPIQGSAAELMKRAMINVDKRLSQARLSSKMVLSVHDELVFDTPKAEVDTLRALVKEEMEGALRLSTPLQVTIGVGANWLLAH